MEEQSARHALTEEVIAPAVMSEPREALSFDSARAPPPAFIEEEVWTCEIACISSTGNTQIKLVLSKAGERGAQEACAGSW
jgi:hypothetical protein